MASRKQRDEEETEKEKPEPKEREEKAESKDDVIELEVGGEQAEEEDADEPEEPRPSRAEKKANRYREAQEKARLAEERAHQAEQRASQYEQWAQQQQMAQYQQQGQQQAQQEWEALMLKQRDMYAAFEAERANATPDRLASWEKRAQEFEREKMQTAVRLFGAGQQVTPQQIAQQVYVQTLKQRYGDILNDQTAYAWADARFRQRAAEGSAVNERLYEEVADETRKRFGLNGYGNQHAPRRPPPDEATRARFSGMSARSSSGGGGEAVKVRIGPNERKIAKAAYPDLSEEKAIQKWANGPGARAARAAAKER